MMANEQDKVELYRAYSVEEIQERREMFSKSDSCDWALYFLYSID